MQELVKFLMKNHLTANQLVLLECIRESIRSQDLIPDLSGEVNRLVERGLLEAGKLTTKGETLLEESQSLFLIPKNIKKTQYITDEFLENLKEFREIFPNRKLPSGKAARTNFDDLKRKMLEFRIKYPKYDWDTILDATSFYVENYRQSDYMYMKTAGYYIMKNNESDLATDCELLLEGGMEQLQQKSLYNAR